jgi:pilus assembly protein TadC
MNSVAVAAFGGAAIGAGVLVLVRQLRPARIPLTTALDRLERTPQRTAIAHAVDSSSVDGLVDRWQQFGRWLADRPLGRPIPMADLAVLDLDPGAFCLRKMGMAIFGLLLPGLTAAALVVTGVDVAPVLPAGLGLALGVGMFFAPDLVMSGQAVEAREAFSAAVGAYLDLVALERAADGAPAEALTRAAAVADSWPFRRIRQELDRARLAGTPPWQALASLASDVGVDDLRDLADILTVAGDDGAAVYDALTAKAASLRTRQLSAAKAAANTASEKLTLPGVLLCFGFLLLVCYPGIARVLGL